MRIYKIAQVSSLMYYIDDENNDEGIRLTPDPFKAEIINFNKAHFSVFRVFPRKYYVPDGLYIDLSDKDIEVLREQGYFGAITGEDIIVFDKESLDFIGEYDVKQKRIIK
ncbi:MAG: hypothetical protein ACR2PH_03600 [Desulfobulbia bacterium]